VLDSLNVDDVILKDDLLKLSKYDFNTDVDVNILGHIFEHSLSEIEEVEAELKGEVADKTKGKRKKDGVFYTPKYITKYIVENTIGKLCSDKKTEFKLDVDVNIFEYQKADGKLNAKGIALYETLNQYKAWLLTLKILDPACGSGAFLNQAVNFLIHEHQFIDDIISELTNTPLRLYDTDIAILENNIYGVDINEESVEIAKLSLWLRTAKQGRKLSNLSNNIKCGNSLIDDPAVAGDKAFNWQKEFPEVFANGGFDVVIGNPPYVRAENIEKVQRDYFISKNSKYSKTFGRFDLYIVFNELALQLLKPNGFLSFIFPSSFFNQNYSSLQRDWFLNELNLIEIADLSYIDVFNGVAVETAIVIVKNQLPTKTIICSKPANELEFLAGNKSIIDKSIFNNLPNKTFRAELDGIAVNLITKIRNNSNLLEDFCYVVIGAVPHNSITGASKDRLISTNCDKPTSRKYIEGKNVNRYSLIWDNRYIDYIPSEMHRPKFPELFENEKLLVRNISTTEGIMATYDDEHFYLNDTMSVLILWKNLINVEQRGVKGSDRQLQLSNEVDLKYLIALVNSKLVNFYFKLILSSNLHVYPEAIRNLPISNSKKINQNHFSNKVDLIISTKRELIELSKKLQGNLQRKFALEEISKKLQEWYLLSYSDFIKELGKKKVKLSLSEEAEWETYFTAEAKKALELKSQIDKTDKEIDQMVYALYELTEDEIKIVEES
jgi:type I restriction-modification system DNA methylase subunit